MRITTNGFYDRSMAQMALLDGNAVRLQTEIATGKRQVTAADDTVGYQQLSSIRRATSNDTAYTANITLAQGLISQADSTLEGVSNNLQRANELFVQAKNGTLNDTQRANIADELDSIVDNLLALANSTDLRGQPLFGGATGDVAYNRAPDGTIAFAGQGNPSPIPIGDGATIQANMSGAGIFGGDGTAVDMFATISDFADALRAGGDIDTSTATALDSLKLASDQVNSARASAGARGARLDLESNRMRELGVVREEARSAIEDIDVSAAISELQKTLTVLQATQASFTKLSGMSLFDYLR